MPAEPKWVWQRVLAWAVVGGVTVDVSKIQIDTQLSSIPQCTLWLPTGVANFSDETSGISAVNAGLANLTTETPVQVWADLSARFSSDFDSERLGLPNGPFLLFEGFAAGLGTTRDGSSLSFMLHVNHWLAKLSEGSALSNSSHPGNPANFSFGALQNAGPGTGAADWYVLSQADRFMTRKKILEDFWGKALYPWFTFLASQDALLIRERGITASATGTEGEVDKALQGVQEALKRLKPGGPRYVPLKPILGALADGAVDIAENIAADVALSSRSVGFAANQTLWDILIGSFAADYSFAVVPRISDALVVPFTPCYRGPGGKVWKTITPDEIYHHELTGRTPRPLRAYGVLGGINSRTGAVGYTGEPIPTVAGLYPALPNRQGAVVIGRSPRWLSAVDAPFIGVATFVGVAEPKGTTVHPGKGKSLGRPAGARRQAEQVLKPLLDRYAQSRYCQEALRGRYGALAGPFRLDIAPGSLIRVQRRTSDLDMALGREFYGEVLRVSLVLDADNRQATTAFHIGHTRNFVENGSSDVTVPRHPFYDQTFLGAPLVEV